MASAIQIFFFQERLYQACLGQRSRSCRIRSNDFFFFWRKSKRFWGDGNVVIRVAYRATITDDVPAVGRKLIHSRCISDPSRASLNSVAGELSVAARKQRVPAYMPYGSRSHKALCNVHPSTLR
jgi:hypothetical protein